MAYKVTGWKFWVPTIFAAVGFLIGLSVLICFSVIYKNYHCAAWGGVSGVLSAITLAMHLAVRLDKEAKINQSTFKGLMITGFLGLLTGIGVFIGYLIKGIILKETGMLHIHRSSKNCCFCRYIYI